jgi:hypothetical protein
LNRNFLGGHWRPEGSPSYIGSLWFRHFIDDGSIRVIGVIRVRSFVVLVLSFWSCRSGFRRSDPPYSDLAGLLSLHSTSHSLTG